MIGIRKAAPKDDWTSDPKDRCPGKWKLLSWRIFYAMRMYICINTTAALFFAAFRLQEDFRRLQWTCMVCWPRRSRHHPACVGDCRFHWALVWTTGGHQRCRQRLYWIRYQLLALSFGNSIRHDRMVFIMNTSNISYLIYLVEGVCVHLGKTFSIRLLHTILRKLCKNDLLQICYKYEILSHVPFMQVKPQIHATPKSLLYLPVQCTTDTIKNIIIIIVIKIIIIITIIIIMMICWWWWWWLLSFRVTS